MVSLKKHLVLSKGRQYNPSSTKLAPACPPAPGNAPSPGWPRRLSQQQSAGPAAPGVQQPHRLRVWAPSPSLGPVLPRAQWGQTKPARWGQRPHWTKSWHDSEFPDTGPISGPDEGKAGLSPQWDRAEPRTVLCACSSFNRLNHTSPPVNVSS